MPPAVDDTISMPGNQGGSNWGTTAANPEKGLVFVVNVNQVALLQARGRDDAHGPEGCGGGGARALQAGVRRISSTARRATARTSGWGRRRAVARRCRPSAWPRTRFGRSSPAAAA